MMKNLSIIFFLLLNIQVLAQVKVPETIYFAGLKLDLNHHVQRTLQTEVDNIRRNPTFFKQKVDRADLYFPLIEKVFQEEGLHDDFKYLVLQESSLVSDAVSSSNAVGYWQFKKESAEEVGLRCDQYVDERMNIVSASRGAAKYLQRNNKTLQNWVYALLSYNMGLGGVRKEVNDKYIGASSMKITGSMHWYVIRFLAHKLAYENEVSKNPAKEMYLVEYSNCAFKSVDEIAAETKLSADEIVKYNKWMRKKMVPNDKEYIVILPVVSSDYKRVLALANSKPGEDVQIADSKDESGRKTKSSAKGKNKGNVASKNKYRTPDFNGNGQHGIVLITTHNKLKAILAKEGDTFEAMSIAATIKLDDFVVFNEVKRFEKPIVGKYYYIQPKRNKALVSQHVVQYDENLWSISQQYGMRMNSILKKNRMSLREEPKVGRVLNLRKKIKKGAKIEYKKVTPKVEPRKVDIVKPAEVSTQKPVEVTVEEPEQQSTKPSTVIVKEPVKETTELPSFTKEQTAPDVEIAAPNTEDNRFKWHTVLQGETLYRLSKVYEVPIDTLKAWNDLSLGLKVGQVVKVGIKATETGDVKEHIVKPGETLYRISKIYGISIDDIMKWNGKADFSVSVGEVLKISVD